MNKSHEFQLPVESRVCPVSKTVEYITGLANAVEQFPNEILFRAELKRAVSAFCKLRLNASECQKILR